MRWVPWRRWSCAGPDVDEDGGFACSFDAAEEGIRAEERPRSGERMACASAKRTGAGHGVDG